MSSAAETAATGGTAPRAVPNQSGCAGQSTPAPGAGPELRFAILDAAAERYAAAPAIGFTLGIENPDGVEVRSILLDVQLQIAARRRSYTEAEQAALLELFGTPERWGATLRTLLWTRATIVIPPFRAATSATLTVPCSYDLEVAAAAYLSALHEQEIPLEFLFAGSVFYSDGAGRLQTVRIGWDREAEYELPPAIWREAIDRHFPGCAWVRLDREAFEALRAYKAAHGLPTLAAAVQRLAHQERG